MALMAIGGTLFLVRFPIAGERFFYQLAGLLAKPLQLSRPYNRPGGSFYYLFIMISYSSPYYDRPAARDNCKGFACTWAPIKISVCGGSALLLR